MAEDRVPVQIECLRQGGDVRGHPLDGPRLLRRGLGASLGPFVHHEQPVAVTQGVQVVTEHVVIQPGAAVQDDQRIALLAAAFHDVQLGVPDVDQARLVLVMHREGFPRRRDR